MFCIAHGGGRQCQYPEGCGKSAEGSTMFCVAHGGGKRCQYLSTLRLTASTVESLDVGLLALRLVPRVLAGCGVCDAFCEIQSGDE
jgi:hypothetical protein